LKTFPAAFHVRDAYFAKAKAIEVPTQNIKNGKTRSQGVHPSHAACRSGGKIFDHEPGLLTMIMKATVRPLSTSNERYLFVIGVIYVVCITKLAI
jgi:hypothetical protein